MRREVSQLQRWVDRGRDNGGTWKVCVTAAHEQDMSSGVVLDMVSGPWRS
jgi:hypothetical protein